MDIKTSVQIADCHVPFHDIKAFDLALDVIKDIDPDEIVLLGDFADFYTFSKFTPNPDSRVCAKEEREDIYKELRRIRKQHPKSKMIYICGNHEQRLVKRMSENPIFWGLTTIEDFLRLKELNISFIPYGPNQKYHILGNENLIAQHEPSSGGENHSRLTLKRNLCSNIYGHHHCYQRSEMISRVGKKMFSVSIPCLANKDHLTMQYPKNHHQWSMGWGITTIINNKTIIQDIITIEDYKCVYGGFAYDS